VFTDADSAQSNLESRLKELNVDLVQGFGLKYGITHAEYIYDNVSDNLYLVEIAARGGGVFISSDLIPAACGINAIDLLVKENIGLSNYEPINIINGASAYFCYLLPCGVISSIEGVEKVLSTNGVYKAYFDNVDVGMLIQSINDKSSRKGPILVKAESKNDCYRIINNVKKVLDIRVCFNGEFFDAIWE
jgi:carbamoyl-phosphate synthase large subunit